MAAARKAAGGIQAVIINPPNMKTISIRIRGTEKYVFNRFSGEAREMMAEDQQKGDVDKPRGRGKKRPPKDFNAGFKGSLYRAPEGWVGVPCTAFRQAMVRAAYLAGVDMTQTKMCVFILADGYAQSDDNDRPGLVKITKGKEAMFIAPVINRGGSPDLRARAAVPRGWEATVSIRYDADFMSPQSITNLLARAGVSVGVGAGRPFSKMSAGQGWGTFEIIPDGHAGGRKETKGR